MTLRSVSLSHSRYFYALHSWLSLLAILAAIPAALCTSAVPYVAPATNGGSQLDSSAGLGEPLNVVISGLSTPTVLTDDGLLNWARSINFSTECLGLHFGNPQTANLGDGAGSVNETAVLRFDFGNANNGTCDETVEGGNHFRYWQQRTTNAFFLAASVEMNLTLGHNIVPNGYDLGRDYIVGNATQATTNFNGVSYKTTNSYISGLLQAGSNGINHGISIDGRVALLTITADAEPGVSTLPPSASHSTTLQAPKSTISSTPPATKSSRASHLVVRPESFAIAVIGSVITTWRLWT